MSNQIKPLRTLVEFGFRLVIKSLHGSPLGSPPMLISTMVPLATRSTPIAVRSERSLGVSSESSSPEERSSALWGLRTLGYVKDFF